MASHGPEKKWMILLGQFYCQHAFAKDNQKIQIREHLEKMIEFS